MKETIPFDNWWVTFFKFSERLTEQDFHCLLLRSFGDTYEEIAKTCPRKTKKYITKGGYKRIENFVGIGITRERVRQLLGRTFRKSKRCKL